MTWNTLTDLAHEQLVTETHMDELRQNTEHLGAMGLAGVAFSALTSGTYGARIAVGSYTGNSTDNRNITGVGFDPKFVIVYGNGTVPRMRFTPVAGDNTISFGGALSANEIQSLITDGFRVGTDGSVNLSAATYYYVCIG